MDNGYLSMFYKALSFFHLRFLNLERAMIGVEYAKSVAAEWNKLLSDVEKSCEE